MSKMPPRKYQKHAFHDRANLAYLKKAAIKKAKAAKKKREAAQAESARKVLEADVAIALVPTTEPPENCRMLVTKIVRGES